MTVTAGPPRLWTPEEVAEFLGIPLRTLYAWRARSKGPRAHRVGRYLRYAGHDVQAWLADQTDARGGAA